MLMILTNSQQFREQVSSTFSEQVKKCMVHNYMVSFQCLRLFTWSLRSSEVTISISVFFLAKTKQTKTSRLHQVVNFNLLSQSQRDTYWLDTTSKFTYSQGKSRVLKQLLLQNIYYQENKILVHPPALKNYISILPPPFVARQSLTLKIYR